MNTQFEFSDKQKSKLDFDQQKSIQNKHKLIQEFAILCKESAEIEKELSQINKVKSSKNLENKSNLYQKLTEINAKLTQIRQEMNNSNQEIKGENRHQTSRQITSQIYDPAIEHHQKEFRKLGEYIQLAEDFEKLKNDRMSLSHYLAYKQSGLVQLDKLISSLNNIAPNKFEIPLEPVPILNIPQIDVIYLFLSRESLTEVNNITIYDDKEYKVFLEIKSIFEGFGFEEKLTSKEIEEFLKNLDNQKEKNIWGRQKSDEFRESKKNEYLKIAKQEKWRNNIKLVLEEFLRQRTEETSFNSSNYDILRELNGRKSIDKELAFGNVYQQMKKEKPQVIQKAQEAKNLDTFEIIKMWTEPIEAKIFMTESSKFRLQIKIYTDLTQETEILPNKSLFRSFKENDKFISLLKELGKKQNLFQNDDDNDKISYYNGLHFQFLTEQIKIFEDKITKLEQEKENKIKLIKLNNIFSKRQIPEKIDKINQEYGPKFQELKTNLGNMRGFLELLQNWKKDRQNEFPTEYAKFAITENICNQLLSKIPPNKVKEIFDKLTTTQTTIDLDREIWGQDSLESAQIIHKEQNSNLRMTVGDLLTKVNQVMTEKSAVR